MHTPPSKPFILSTAHGFSLLTNFAYWFDGFTVHKNNRHDVVLCRDGVILEIDTEQALASRGYELSSTSAAAHLQRIDCQQGSLFPGLIDCHTHTIFAGNRLDEYIAKSRGASYAEIHATGGGIMHTTQAVRQSSIDDLVAQAESYLRIMLYQGVTTVEIKTGYGLSVIDELKILDAIQRLQKRVPMTLIPTLMAAHSIPPEYIHKVDDYVDLIIHELIPRAHHEYGVRSIDMFVEEGAFNISQARRMSECAQALQWRIRIHAEQLSHSGGAQLAAEVHAAAASHLEYTTRDDCHVLGQAGVVCEILPIAQLFTKLPSPPISHMRDSGCRFAVATDFNPGSAMAAHLPLAASLSVALGLTTQEALQGITSVAADSLDLNGYGRVQKNARADVVIRRGRPEDICYRWAFDDVLGVATAS